MKKKRNGKKFWKKVKKGTKVVVREAKGTGKMLKRMAKPTAKRVWREDLGIKKKKKRKKRRSSYSIGFKPQKAQFDFGI